MTLQQAQPLFKEWQRITHKPLGELLFPTWLCDGEALPDWDAWFEHHDTKEPLAIIHFTNYRY